MGLISRETKKKKERKRKEKESERVDRVERQDWIVKKGRKGEGRSQEGVADKDEVERGALGGSRD